MRHWKNFSLKSLGSQNRDIEFQRFAASFTYYFIDMVLNSRYLLPMYTQVSDFFKAICNGLS